jgi:hypothetical protein
MFRTFAIGAVTVAALLAPSIASAGGKGMGGGWKGGGYHHFHGGHFYGGSAFYVAGNDCLQYRTVETRRGLRTRLVNVCD